MKLNLLDAAIALWALFVCSAFVLPNALGAGWVELVTVARYVYTGVLAVGFICLAVRSTRMLGW